jgi:hypothetical protein
MIVIKTAAHGGGETTKMTQKLAQTYLGNLLGNGSPRLTNLSQAMNQAFDGQGKACGDYTYNGHKPLHASAGKAGVSSVTLFYYLDGGTLYCFAMGEHVDSTTYEISDFGPATGDFKENGKIRLS